MATPILDPEWPYARHHRKLHLKQSAKEIQEQRAQLMHRLVADAWDMPLAEVGERIAALDSMLAKGDLS